MTAPFSLNINYGNANGVPIIASVNAGSWNLVYVTLSYNYSRSPPGDAPVPPYPGPVSGSPLASPSTIAANTRLQLFAGEAASLVAAGAAVYS
jgi:hypothetical protein